MIKMAATMIVPNLVWLGGTSDAQDIKAVKENGIKAIINLRTTRLRGVEGCDMHWHPLIDWYGNHPEMFADAVNKLIQLQKDKVPTLVHCHMGISRSPTVLATWFALDTGITFDEAIDVIRKMRPFIMPCEGLRDLAKAYLGEPTNAPAG